MKIQANGIQINYELYGEEGAPVVMLSHPLGCNMDVWQPQLGPLGARFRLLRYDLRGHGESDAPRGPYTLELLAEDAAGLLDALGIDAAHFVGLSIGGMIGQGLAMNHSQRVRRLALCDTSPILPPPAHPVLQERIDRAREKGLAALVQETMERWFTASYLAKKPPAFGEIRNQFLATPQAGYIGCSEAIRGLNYLERLKEITHPTLIIVGEDDPGTPVSAAESIHERIAGSRLVVIPRASHLCNVEQAEVFNSVLVEFLLAQ
jgi:3-oxoadipate enol-lactonase